MNQQIFGKFQADFPNDREFLNIGFSPSSLSIQQRWRNNGLSADFVADYMTTFFPRQSESQSEQYRQAELKHAEEQLMRYTVKAERDGICPTG